MFFVSSLLFIPKTYPVTQRGDERSLMIWRFDTIFGCAHYVTCDIDLNQIRLRAYSLLLHIMKLFGCLSNSNAVDDFKLFFRLCTIVTNFHFCMQCYQRSAKSGHTDFSAFFGLPFFPWNLMVVCNLCVVNWPNTMKPWIKWPHDPCLIWMNVSRVFRIHSFIQLFALHTKHKTALPLLKSSICHSIFVAMSKDWVRLWFFAYILDYKLQYFSNMKYAENQTIHNTRSIQNGITLPMYFISMTDFVHKSLTQRLVFIRNRTILCLILSIGGHWMRAYECVYVFWMHVIDKITNVNIVSEPRRPLLGTLAA